VVTDLEHRYALFDGLNLTWEAHEGLAKHNGPLVDAAGHTIGVHAGGKLPFAIRVFQERQDLELDLYAGLEAQAAAIADDVAYDCHDLEDGLRAGLIGLADLEEQPLTQPVLAQIRAEFPGLEPARVVHEFVRRSITLLISDVLSEAQTRIAAQNVRTVDDVRRAGRALIGFSPDLAHVESGLKRFLTENVYRDETVMRQVRLAEAMIADLFESFFSDPARMPDEWGEHLDPADPFPTARRVSDYIAGMTDRYAIAEHQRLFGNRSD
jgi:dGTPase